jgi:hypothetical protein
VPTSPDAETSILQVNPVYAAAAAPTTARLWQVPGGYEGRLLSVYYILNYSAARNIDKQSWVEVLSQHGDVLGRWKAPQMDWSLSMLTFDASGVSLAIEIGETIIDPATTIVFTPQQVGSLPSAWLPELTVFNLVMDTDDGADFLSDVMTMVEERATGPGEPEILGPFRYVPGPNMEAVAA